jgi:hypothetical protein
MSQEKKKCSVKIKITKKNLKNKILNFFKNEKDSYKDKKSNFEIK